MFIADLLKELEKNPKKYQTATVTIDMGEVNHSAINAFKDGVTIPRIILRFPPRMPLKKRSEMLTGFTPFLDNVNGLKTIYVEESVDLVSLSTLLKKTTHAEEIKFYLPPSSSELSLDFDNELTIFLSTNKNLRSLTIVDEKGVLQNKPGSTLHQTFLEHPTLEHFSQTSVKKNKHDLLSHDTALQQHLKQKKLEHLYQKAIGSGFVDNSLSTLKEKEIHLIKLKKVLATEEQSPTVISQEMIISAALLYVRAEIKFKEGGCLDVLATDPVRTNAINAIASLISGKEIESEKYMDQLSCINKYRNDSFNNFTRTLSANIQSGLVTYSYPASYSRIVKGASVGTGLQQAKALLNDYTKNYSMISRFFHGHWNRHHVKEVNAIVEAIDNGQIHTMEDLLDELHAIALVNTEGSLAQRIRFIEHYCPLTPEVNTTTFSLDHAGGIKR